MPFTDQIRTLWKDSKLTLAQLAELCDISESSASRYINGKINPPVDVAERILEVLKESKPKQPQKEAAMVRQLHEVYETQIADLRRDKTILFIALMVMIALVVYLFIDALHGNWGLIQYPV